MIIPYRSYEEYLKYISGRLEIYETSSFIGPAGICGTSGIVGPAGISGKTFDMEKKEEEKNNIPSIDEWMNLDHGNY